MQVFPPFGRPSPRSLFSINEMSQSLQYMSNPKKWHNVWHYISPSNWQTGEFSSKAITGRSKKPGGQISHYRKRKRKGRGHAISHKFQMLERIIFWSGRILRKISRSKNLKKKISAFQRKRGGLIPLSREIREKTLRSMLMYACYMQRLYPENSFLHLI